MEIILFHFKNASTTRHKATFRKSSHEMRQSKLPSNILYSHHYKILIGNVIVLKNWL